jgi:hypothetical protein
VRNPINPNKALNRFVKADAATGIPAFDAVSWTDMAKADVSWDAVSWADVSWSDVSWADVSWSDVSWADVSWADVLAVADVSWEDAAGDETIPPAGEEPSEAELEAELLGEPDLYPLPDPVTEAEPTEPVAEADPTEPVADAEPTEPVTETVQTVTTP